MATLVEQIRAQGGDWNIGGIDRAQELADLLSRQGITSLDGLALNKEVIPGSWQEGGSGGETPDAGYMSADSFKHTLTAGGKTIGFAGDYNNDGSYGGGKWEGYDRLQDINGDENSARVGWSARGDGGVSYNVEVGSDGRARLVPVWGSTSDKDRIQRGLMGAAGVIAAPFALNAALGAAGITAGGAPTTGLLGGAADPLAGYMTTGGAEGSFIGSGVTAAPGAAVPAGVGGAAAGGASGAAAVADPLAGYMTAGGAEGSIAGSGVTAAAGAALPAGVSSIPSWLPAGLQSSWDFIKGNPKLIGALAGGLLGGVGATQGEEAPAPYTGPMPTITRGNFNASPTGYKPMTQQSYGGGLLSTPGTKQAASGMHRYMGLLGGG